MRRRDYGYRRPLFYRLVNWWLVAVAVMIVVGGCFAFLSS